MNSKFSSEMVQHFAEVVTDVARIGGWVVDLSSQRVLWSSPTYEIFGTDPKEDISLEDAISYFLEDYRETATQRFDHATSNGQSFQFEAEIKTQDGVKKWVKVHGRPLLDNDQKPTHVVGIFEDITQRIDAFERINTQQQYLTSVIASILEGLIVINKQGKICSFNTAAASIFGYKEHEVLNENIAMLMPNPHSDRHDNYIKNYHQTSIGKIIGIGREVMGRRKNQQVFPMYVSVAEVEIKGETHFLGTVRDLSKEKESARKIEWLSNYDEQTGLPNRSYLLNYMEKQGVEQHITVVSVNIDRFKRIFLAYGQNGSEQVLKSIADRLKANCNEHDFICKDFADRFWLVLPDEHLADHHQLEARLESLKTALEAPYLVNGQRHYISATLGAAYSEPTPHAVNLLSKAELAMHDAKRRGNGLYNIYQSDHQHSNILEEYDTERQLREGLERDELVFYVQPKYTSGGELVSAELLVRWQKPDGTMAYPDSFISIAEESGLIQQIGEQALERAAQMLAELAKINCSISLAVNVSPIQFLNEQFVSNVISVFDQYRVDLSKLIIEVTENLLITDIEVEEVRNRTRILESLGAKISIDDFGTGYSSLQRIQELTISEIKIDKSFTWKCQDEKGRELVNAMIQIGKSMRLTVVAEGVETKEQLNELRDMGVDVYQGYLFNKPMTFEAFIQQLRD